MGLHHHTSHPPTGSADSIREPVAPGAEKAWTPRRGAYLTDETGLFRVQDAIANRGELFLELENCATLELILCPARTVARLGLRSVAPAPPA